MLRLLLGRSGTGKTWEIEERLTGLAREGTGPLYLLVPEQFSFESERAMLERLGPRLAGRVQVLSFTRLADAVTRELGGRAGRRMDDATRMLLMSAALEQVSDQLTVYRRQAGDADYVRSALSLLTECRQCDITPRQLEETADRMEEGILQRKTRELALILGAYDAVASSAYIDPLDELSVLARQMGESRLFDGARVFVDSFKGFTEQELKVLEAVIRRAEEVTVSLCAESGSDTEEGLGLFSPAARTAQTLREIAQRNGIPAMKAEILTENRRCREPALRLVEEGCFRPCPQTMEEETDRVTLAVCADRYEECDFTAREIRRLLREEGGYFRDFAVVVRSTASYEGILDVALEKAGIASYRDQRENLMTDPLPVLIISALQAVEGFDTDDILRLMKTGLAGFSPRSVSLLENYSYLWRIGGRQWREEWTGHPEGLSAPASEGADRLLIHLNRLRRRLMRPLERLYFALHPGLKEERKTSRIGGREFAAAVYQYLTDVRAGRMVRLQAARLETQGERALAERMADVWDTTMELLDRVAEALRDSRLPAARYGELLRLAMETADLGAIPQTLDAVQVGAADHIRFSKPRTVFVLGANEGVFPAVPAGGGLISDLERRRLIEWGLPMADASEREASEERFYAYAALSAPSERLIVSYTLADSTGEKQAPSVIVEAVRRIVPHCRQLAFPSDIPEDIETETEAFERAASLWRDVSSKPGASLREVFRSRKAFAGRLRMLERAAADRPAAFHSQETARRFFGDDMRLSPSRVESYHLCRFSYFCRYGLRAAPRRPADLDALEFGTLAHYVMEQLVPRYAERGFERVGRGEVHTSVEETVHRYVEECMGGLGNKNGRFLYLLTRLIRTCDALLWQVVKEMRESRFRPADYELSIGLPADGEDDEPEVAPLLLTLPDGACVRVQGKVDRVDTFREGERTYVRVVDYKTGTKQFDLSQVVEGLNLQMLIYLMAIWDNGEPRYGPVTPAGVLYLPARLPVIRVGRETDGDELEKARTRAMRMNGLLLEDPEVVRAMEPGAAGLFLPAKLNAKGEFDRYSSVASLEQMGKLKKRIEKLLIDMAATLRAGDVAAVPATGTADACAYCDYRAVCGREQGDPVRYLAAQDRQEVLRSLQEDGE
ncbi:MAG: helicase [Clostridiales bacterium]|nr:helicase [Clostridiales bacterium]